MPVTLSVDAQLVFFNKVFGPTSDTTGKVKALLQAGVTFEVSLYAVRAYVGKKALEPVQLTYGTTSLMKGTADPTVEKHNKKLIEDWIFYLYHKQGAPSVQQAKPALTDGPVAVWLKGTTGTQPHLLHLIKAAKSLTAAPLKDVKAQVDAAVVGTPQLLGVYQTLVGAQEAEKILTAAGGKVELLSGLSVHTHPVHLGIDWAKPEPTKPVDKVIDLKDAKALGQKVHGTSTGSVYYTIALTDHVKVAARLMKGGAVSIRVEWTGDPKDDLKKLAEAGIGMKNGYGSIHFDAADVPMPKVIGAFLFGSGVNWKQAVANGAELIIGGQ